MIVHYLIEESKTYISIRYDTSNGKISIAPNCHVLGEFYRDGRILVCSECSRMWSSKLIQEAIDGYSTSWNFSRIDHMTIDVLTRWLAAWTGIAEEDLNVKVEPR